MNLRLARSLGLALVLVLALVLLLPAPAAAEVAARTDRIVVEEIDEERPIDVERHENGILFLLRQADAREAYLEGSFDEWKRIPMRAEEGIWSCEKRLRKGVYRFRVLYRLAGEDRWFEEPTPDDEHGRGGRSFYALEVEDRGISWYEEEAELNTVDGDFGGSYNRVEGVRLSYALAYDRGIRRTARFGWSQSYAFAAERWSWEVKAAVPIRPLPGLRIEAEGFDRIRVPTAWTVTPEENLAAALLISEDFFDYVWSRGWTARLVVERGSHALSGGYGVVEDEAAANATDWSVFGRRKDFRPNLFASPEEVDGTSRRIEGRYAFDSRNYGDTPTLGWLLRLEGDYAGWELGGDRDYWRGIADLRRYQKLAPGLHLDFRLLGGSIRGNAPVQELFRIGGIGTMRAHRLKELVGERMFLANLESRVSVTGDIQCAFFADLGDAWHREGREEFDLESDMGIGLLDEDGDFRIDFARRLGRGVDDDLAVTVRLARMF